MFKKRVKKEKKKIGKNFSKRDFLLVFVLIFSLAAFFHFRERRFFVFEINSTAPNDIIAIQDFSYLDKKQMIVLKQEALVDLGKIWKIKESDLKSVQADVMRRLSNHPNWRSSYQATFNEMKHIVDVVTKELERWHFTGRRTYRKREEIDLSVRHYSIVENVVTKKSLTLPNEFWTKLEREVREKNRAYSREIEYIIGIFRGNRYLLQRDHEERSAMESSIYETVPEVFSSRAKNDLIVKKGDRISEKEYEQILALKEALKRNRQLLSVSKLLSSLLLSLVVVGLGWAYCVVRNSEVLKNTNKLSIYILTIILTCVLAKSSEFVINAIPYSIASYFQYPIIIPFLSVILALFLDEEIALFTSLYFSVVLGFTLALEHNHFVVLNIFSGILASLYSSSIKKRKEIFIVCIKVWALCAATIIIYFLSSNTLFEEQSWIQLVALAGNIIIIAVLLLITIPIIESMFRVMTNMALMEFIDPTHPLLQRLSLEAPGTYQHSLSIGHISEYAANAIGANGMLCRVTTLYHDIGKLNNPHYYTENQLITGQKPFNIHQLLTPIESAYIIKSHILDGKSLAKQYNLPKIFIDIILEHHGTTLIKFFHHKQLEKMKGVKEDVEEKAFRYPGPKPQTKESAIIMLSDSIEAASRTLEENTEEAVRELVEKITSTKILDGQFDECDLTFDELATIKQKLVEIIKATHHLRIKYPDK
ncbi:MAG: hypothetical protein S4CHLAM20_10220 [Chlamydiia bacterium]|nr:hypothetical protein [Chlamydiia bacterium]